MNKDNRIAVIFVCTGNSCRSQMAEGFLRHWAGDRVRVKSAGSHPTFDVSRATVEVMREIGIDISRGYPKSFEDIGEEKFDFAITLCDYARDFCPVFHSEDGESKRLHWSVEDPYMASSDPVKELEIYRAARDEIADRIIKWMDEELGIKVVYDRT